jgi:hypothetical protein
MNKVVLAIAVLISFPTLINAQIDTNTVVFSWKLDDDFANHIRVVVDTSLENFQNQNPIFRNYTSVSTLGNYGQPSISNIFTERDRNQEFLLINPFYPFMQQFNTTRYFNTRKPFSRISYYKGGSSQNKEEILDAQHSQNLTKTLNVGMHYTTVGSLGQYRFQKVKNNSFSLFSSLTGPVYSYHTSLNLNKIVADENGGVLGDSLITDTTYALTKDIPTLFDGIDNPPRHEPNVYTEVRNMNLFTMQEIAFRGKRTKPDSGIATKKLRIFYPKLIYIFYFNRVNRLFKDKDPAVGLNNGLYPAVHINDALTADSLIYWKIFNSARLQFQGKRSNHYFIDYSYELMQYSMTVPSSVTTDSLSEHWFIFQKAKLPGISVRNGFFNSSVSTGFNKVFLNHVELNLFGRYYLSGYRSTDFLITGDLKLFTGKMGKQNSLIFRAVNELKTPDFLYTHYASNNFMWSRNFKKTSTNHLSMNLTVLSKKFDIQADYFLLHHIIYFNEQALPEQFHKALSILSLSASKRFDFWRISSTTKLVYQKTDNQEVLGLPALSVYNSTYLTQPVHFRATDGRLLTILGFDLFYNSRYYADAYMPSLTAFYRQSQKQLGNYPYIDAYLNVQLKRLRFYIKFENVNSSWGDKKYFSVLHYPRNERNLKFGLAWTFYD